MDGYAVRPGLTPESDLTGDRYARLRLNGGRHTHDEWYLLRLRCGFLCVCCGLHESEGGLTRDHILPVSLGGGDGIENIQPLCSPCQAKKGIKVIDYRPRANASFAYDISLGC